MTGPDCTVMCNLIKGNGQKRELPVLFDQKRVYLETIAAESAVGRI